MKDKDPNHQYSRDLFFKNYDYGVGPEPTETSPGGGLFSNMDKFKSQEEFLKYKRKRRKKYLKAMLEFIK